ncbi:MAG: hypothetical protein C5B59_13525 [Bacteroidetes bacterium]|nr:MAG: hypothetical protein C5B59_13525 [Bacteroidota bacterium]
MQGTFLRRTGILFTRTLLGLIFFMQGFGKVFMYTIPEVYGKFFKDFENTFLPKWVIWFAAYYTSYVELVAGFLLIIGLFRKCAYYLLALDLLIVSFGHGLIEPIWDLSHVMPRALLLIVLLLAPEDWDQWNLDGIRHNKIKA